MGFYNRRQAIRAAKDLGYSEEVIKKLEKAKNYEEARKILMNARLNY